MRIYRNIATLAVLQVLCFLLLSHSVAKMAVCPPALPQGSMGVGKSLTTFAVSLGIVVVYYGILVAWFWHMIPIAAAHI